MKQMRTNFAFISHQDRKVLNKDIPPLVFILGTLICGAVAVQMQLFPLMAVPILIWLVAVPSLDNYLARKQGECASSQVSGSPSIEVPLAAVLSILTLSMLVLVNSLSVPALCVIGATNGLLIVLALHHSHRDALTSGGLLMRSFATVLVILGLAPQFCRRARQAHIQIAATPEDPSSARMGEGYYRFLGRYMRGVFCADSRTSKFIAEYDWHRGRAREIVSVFLLFGVYCGLMVYLGGMKVMFFVAAQLFVVAWQLSAFDYLERYGQMRKSGDAGHLEALSGQHLWSGRGVIENMLLNKRGLRAVQAAQTRSGEYQETSAKIYDYGFHVLSLMILSPRLWFRYVNPLLAAKVGYDLARVNLDGDAYVELMEAYHRIEA